MNTKISTCLIALAFTAGCSTMPESNQLADAEGFPPQVIFGVTTFAQGQPPDTLAPASDVPPPVISGVTKFAQTVIEPPVVDSSVPQPVVWARFGVTVEAAAAEERKTAERAAAHRSAQTAPAVR